MKTSDLSRLIAALTEFDIAFEVSIDQVNRETRVILIDQVYRFNDDGSKINVQGDKPGGDEQ